MKSITDKGKGGIKHCHAEGGTTGKVQKKGKKILTKEKAKSSLYPGDIEERDQVQILLDNEQKKEKGRGDD